MSEGRSDWRDGSAYDYFDDLTPEQTAFEFLRRNPDYAKATARRRVTHRRQRKLPPARIRTGGCDFVADPQLRADRASIVWLPRHNPRMALLTSAVPILFDGQALDAVKPYISHSAPEGEYANLAGLPPANQALILGATTGGNPAALIVPLDELFEDRISTARRLWGALRRRGPIKPMGFTAQRRRRLKLVLRALDGDLAGADYREIARAVFGDHVPDGAEWRTHSLRSATIRLVQEGRALMRGGYLKLLCPDRRER